MSTRGGFLFEKPGRRQVVDIEAGPPTRRELLVEMVASGLCNSNNQVAKGDIVEVPELGWGGGRFPVLGVHPAGS